ncbi:hypothetical protein ODJ79_10520 [Actinoplanes sp. KI2]|uniref:hypothetical protein n=1 Tax=Actinoplanes sp. KI2 TaxID=2983315 RepID=UPI0021D57063|nr:hypothetical protein [Actinoplanes sp. KI2]MCU7724149.1 hypothetical protein [Actinoplanes sp. KI2]
MIERCALDALLSPGGPVRVAVRPCCLAALVGRRPPDPPVAGGASFAELVCAAAAAESDSESVSELQAAP